jgi:hypothetical protein
VLFTIGALCLGFAILALACRWLQNELLSVIFSLSVVAGLVSTRVFGDREFSMLLQRLSTSSFLQILSPKRSLKATPSLVSNDDEQSDPDLATVPFPPGQLTVDPQNQIERERRAA